MEDKITEQTSTAISIKTALDGLDKFIFHYVSSTNVTIEDVSALAGMVKAIQSLADNHAQALMELER